MLEFFRKYQRFMFIFVTVIVVASFSFFGAYSTFSEGEKNVDFAVARALDGAEMQYSELQKLSRFLATDREDSFQERGFPPNLMNDGVIRYDFLRSRLADLLVSSYLDAFREDLQFRLEKAKRYRPYAHPDAPFISAKAVWERFIPSLNRELAGLQTEAEVSQKTFFYLSKLYQQQSYLQPEMLRRILVYQHQQCPWLSIDQRLSYEDLSLFGFHSLADWFGQNFLDLIAQFIWNAAAVAEEKGYSVSFEEAKGDLLHNYQKSLEKLKEAGSFGSHLQRLGFDEKSAVEAWRKVLLFRRYFHDVGGAVFVDRLPYKNFAGFALEAAVVDQYECPIRLRNLNDLLSFEFYLKAVSPQSKEALSIPTEFYTVDEVERQSPELVQTSFRAKFACVSKGQAGLCASIKEVWDWELEEKNWSALKKKFPFLSNAETRDGKFQTLEKLAPDQRSEIDSFARECLVDQNPSWIEESLDAVPLTERRVSLSISEDPKLIDLLEKAANQEQDAAARLKAYESKGNQFCRYLEVEKVSDKEILSFEKAKPILSAKVDRVLEKEYEKLKTLSPQKLQTKEGAWKPVSEAKETVARLIYPDLFKAIEGLKEGSESESAAARRLLAPARKALAALQKNPQDSLWLKGSESGLKEQFKFVKKEKSIQRTSEEDWMKEEAFVMLTDQWSTIHVADDGEIVFFYLKEKRPVETPILEQLAFGKETLSADAGLYLAERLISAIQKKQAIVIPLQREVE